MNNNQLIHNKIYAETFFAKVSKDILFLEDEFVRMDKSIIWQCNELFWKHYTLWEKTYNEHYEATLPTGISESHRTEFIENSARKFLELCYGLQTKDKLPEKIFVLEQGPGTGIFAKGFLDYIQKNNSEVYARVVYILSDISEAILHTSVKYLQDHEGHIKAYVQDAFEDSLQKYQKKILFARHSNMWGQLPCRLISVRNSGLAETYVRALCDRKFAAILSAIQGNNLEFAILNYPTLWKEFFRSIKLQARSIPFSTIEVRQNTYLQCLQKSITEAGGKKTLLSKFILENLDSLNGLIDWDRKGYVEVVDLITPLPTRKMYPLKFDGAISYKVDGRIITTWGENNQRNIVFTPIRKLNTMVTITNKN